MRTDFIDLVGRTFHSLTVVEYAGRSEDGAHWWKCECSCGNVKAVRHKNLLYNNGVKSCGCRLRKSKGLSRSPIYFLWHGMIERCTNPNHNNYHLYGGRGIRVCERWMSFANFFDDMGHRPAGCSLERSDNNGPYSPDNCHWATVPEQNRNRRNNCIITFDGKTMCLTEWAEQIGISPSGLKHRITYLNWPLELALTTPPVDRRPHFQVRRRAKAALQAASEAEPASRPPAHQNSCPTQR